MLPVQAHGLIAGSWQLAAGSWQLAFTSFTFIFNNMYMAPAFALMQNSVEPSKRAISSAILLFIVNIVGIGGGPTLVGFVSDHVNETLGLSPLRTGMLALIPLTLIVMASHLAVAWSITRDRASASKARDVAESLAI